MPDIATTILPLKPRSMATSRAGSPREAAEGDLFLGVLLSLQAAPAGTLPIAPNAADWGRLGIVAPDRRTAATLELTGDQLDVVGTSATSASGPNPDGRAETLLSGQAMWTSGTGGHANPVRFELPTGASAVVEPSRPPLEVTEGIAPHDPVRLGNRSEAGHAGPTCWPTAAPDGQPFDRSRTQVPDLASTLREPNDRMASTAAASSEAFGAPSLTTPDLPQEAAATDGGHAPPHALPSAAPPGFALAPVVAQPDPAPVVPTTPAVATLRLEAEAKAADVKGAGVILRLRVSDRAAHRVSIEIEPADLGPVAVSFEIDQSGHAKATFTAERAETLHLLRRDAQALTDLLNASGVAVGQGDLGFNLGHHNQDQDMGQRDLPSARAPCDGAGQDAPGSAQSQPTWMQPRGLLDLEV